MDIYKGKIVKKGNKNLYWFNDHLLRTSAKEYTHCALLKVNGGYSKIHEMFSTSYEKVNDYIQEHIRKYNIPYSENFIIITFVKEN